MDQSTVPMPARHGLGVVLGGVISTLVGVLIGAAGCYETPKPECAFRCAAQPECAPGYVCAADGWCKRDDVAATFDCDPGGQVDGATIDSSGETIDAQVIDADPAAPDANVDAVPPDANVD